MRLRTTFPTHTRVGTRCTHTQPVTSQHTRAQRVDITPPGARPGDNGLGKSNSHYVCPPTHKHKSHTLFPSNCPGLSASTPSSLALPLPSPLPVPSFGGPSVSPVQLALVINRQTRQAGRGPGPTGPWGQRDTAPSICSLSTELEGGGVFKHGTHGNVCVQMCVPTRSAILMGDERRHKDKEEDILQVLTFAFSIRRGLQRPNHPLFDSKYLSKANNSIELQNEL